MFNATFGEDQKSSPGRLVVQLHAQQGAYDLRPSDDRPQAAADGAPLRT